MEISGKRIAVSLFNPELKVDDELSEIPVSLPFPKTNKKWLQPGGNSSHLMEHLDLDDAPEIVWQTSIGTGSSESVVLSAAPVIYDGKIVTLDTSGRLRAFRSIDGRLIWEVLVNSSERDSVFGGGLSAGENKLFIALGSGEIICLDLKFGKELWRIFSGHALRSAPTYSDGRLFVVSIDNKAMAFSASSGKKLWSHSGMPEIAALLGAASPAVKNSVVILAYSSGELYAVKAETGRIFWGDTLSSRRRSRGVAGIAHIRGSPVIDKEFVLATSHSGRLKVINFKNGQRRWERPIGGKTMPWVAGNFVYVVSSSGQIICLRKQDGGIKWLSSLPEVFGSKDDKTAIYYTEPVLAGDRLIIASSRGNIYSISPYTGKILGETKIGAGFYIGPLVVNKTLFLLDDDGILTAFR